MSSDNTVSLSSLRTLHRLHRQLTDLRERLERGPKQINATDANIKHQEGELQRTRDDLKAHRMSYDQKQLELKAAEGKIKELRTKLNTATSNREYQILKDQIAADEMSKSVLEDEIIEILEVIDQFQPKIAAVEAGLAAARQRTEQVRAEVLQQQPVIQHDIDRLEAELLQTESGLPGAIREVYQRIVRQRGEDALAEVDGLFCGGCHQQVPLNLLAEIRMAHPMFCKSCGRLLYLPESFAPIPRSDE